MQSAGELSAPAWPCAYTSVGGLFVRRTIHTNKLAAWIFRPDIVNFHAVGKLRMDHPSRSPQLEGTGGASALIPGDGRVPCSLVGNSILGDRLDVRTSFGAAISGISERRLCGTARYRGANATRILTDPRLFWRDAQSRTASRQSVHALGLLRTGGEAAGHQT